MLRHIRYIYPNYLVYKTRQVALPDKRLLKVLKDCRNASSTVKKYNYFWDFLRG